MSFQNYLPHTKSESPSDVILAQRECVSKIKDNLIIFKQQGYSNWNKFIIINSLIMYYTEVLNKTSQNNPLVLQFQKESEDAIKIWDNVKWLTESSTNQLKEYIQYKVDYIVKILIEVIAQKDKTEVLIEKNAQLKLIFPNIGSFVNNKLSIDQLVILICSNLEAVLKIHTSQTLISSNLYNSFINKIEQIIVSYESNDTNYSAKILQQSLELTFIKLVSIAEPYRQYTTPVFTQNTSNMTGEQQSEANKKNANVFQSFLDLQSRKSLIENKNDPNGVENFFKIQQAKGLKSVDYRDNNPSWKIMCETLSKELIDSFAPYGNINYLLVSINNLLSKYNSQKINADSFTSIPELTIEERPSGPNSSTISEITINENSAKYYIINNVLQNFKGHTLNYYDNLNKKKYVKIIDFSISNRKATLENSITISKDSTFYLSSTPQSIYIEKEITFPITYSKINNTILTYNTNTNITGTIKYDLNFFENNILGLGALPNNYNYWTAYKTQNLDITHLTGAVLNSNAKTSLLRDGNLFKITKSNPLELASGTGHYLSFFPPASGTYNVTLNIPSSGTESWKNDIDFYILDTSKNNEIGIKKLSDWSISPIENNFSKLTNTYQFLNTNNHKFCIHFKNSSQTNNYIFNAPFISQDTMAESKTISGTSGFLNSLNFSNFYRSGANSTFNLNRVTNTKLALKSAPYYVGSNKSITISNFTTEFNGTYTGYNALTITNTGNEKKYYDIFFELLIAILKLINNYAIARMMVPEAFQPEEIFNNDFKVRQGRESLKSFLDDLLEDSGLTFKEMVDKVQKDPRADMLKVAFPYDLPKELEWKSGKLADTFDAKTLKKIKSSLSSIKQGLSKVKNLLEAVRSFVKILDALMTLGEDLLGAVLEEIISQLNKTVDSISSLGIYFLPLWQIYETGSSSFLGRNIKGILSQGNTEDGATGTQSSFVIPFTSTDGEINTNKVYTNNFYSDLYEANRDIIEQDSMYPPPYTKNKNSDLWGMLSPFRATTYSEFISNIEKCFYDEDDKLDPQFKKFEEKKNSSDGEKQKRAEIEWIQTNSQNVIRPGRPLWTSSNTAKVVVLAATFPAPADFTGGIKGFLGLFLPLIETYEWLAKTNTNIGDDLREVLGLPDEDFSKIDSSEEEEETANLLKPFNFRDSQKDSEGKVITYSSGRKWWGNIADNFSRPTLQEVLDKNKGVLYRTGEPPNFIGLTVGSIFPGPIYYLKNLISRLEGLNKKDDEPSLMDTLKSWFNKIDKKIEKIEEIIAGVESLINLIDKILNISLTYLIIDSTGGVDDIMAQLQSADGFPSEDESQIILGCVVGYSVGGTGFDMGAYFRCVEEQFKEEKSALLGDLLIQNEEDGLSQINKFFGGK